MREQPWMRHVTHQMTKLIFEAQRCLQITLGLEPEPRLEPSQARRVCGARCDRTALHRCVL